MRRYLRNLGFQTRLRVFILSLLLILFISAGLMINSSQTKRILEMSHKSVNNYINDLFGILEISSNHYKSLEINNELYHQLKPVFQSKDYFEGAKVFIIQSDGKYVIHPYSEGRDGTLDYANAAMLRAMLNSDINNFTDVNNELYAQHFRYFEPFNAYLVIVYSQKLLLEPMRKGRMVLIILVGISLIITTFLLYLVLRPFSRTLNNLNNSLLTLSNGELIDKLEVHSNDEVGKIVHSVNKLIEGLNQTADFSMEIEKGNYGSAYQPLSANDALGNSMLKMRESLKNAAEEDVKRRKEDNERNWVTTGLAKFGDILRTNYSSTKELGEMVIQNLVKYLDANQGGVFQVNDENESDKYLELIAAFAYDRKKYLTKKIIIGEGLVGACAIEKQTIYMTRVPQGYISITSGLGDANPDCLLIVPLKLEDKIYGVIEMASFSKLEQYQIEFVEKVAESIASTISAVKINARTSALLQQSQQQAEEMAAQEEEMRQNMEELQATQEESARREFELMNLVNSLDKHFLRSEFSQEGKMITSNELFLSTLEYSVSELHATHFASTIAGEDDNTFLADWQSISSGKDFQGVVTVKTGKGNKVWLIMSLSAVYDKDGELLKILCFAKDITALKAGEVHLRQEIQRFEELKTDWQGTVKDLKKK